MVNIELYIEGQKVDLENDIDIAMNYEVNDFENPEAQKSSYSKTIKLKGTTTNNRIFGHIYKNDKVIQIEGATAIGLNFNPNHRAEFTLVRNGGVLETGFFTLDNIEVKNNDITYNITLYGGVADFFYNLQYQSEDEASQRTLADMYYGIDGLNKEAEEVNSLIEYNSEYVYYSWYAFKQMYDSSGFNTSPATSNLMFCPIPTYNGYIADGDADKILINKNFVEDGYMSQNLWIKELNDGKEASDVTYYHPYKDWELITAPREMDEWEVGSFRSHYLRLGVRNKNIWDAICNPENNGGYEVDFSNVNQRAMDYINKSYTLLKSFDWSDIAQENDTTQKLTFGKAIIEVSEDNNFTNSTNSEEFDISTYKNPHITIYYQPQIRVNTSQCYNALYTSYITNLGNLGNEYFDLTQTYMKQLPVIGMTMDKVYSLPYNNIPITDFSTSAYIFKNGMWSNPLFKNDNANTSGVTNYSMVTMGGMFVWYDFYDANGTYISSSDCYIYGRGDDVMKDLLPVTTSDLDGVKGGTMKEEQRFCQNEFKKLGVYKGNTFNWHWLNYGTLEPNVNPTASDCEFVGTAFGIPSAIPKNAVKIKTYNRFFQTTRMRPIWRTSDEPQYDEDGNVFDYYTFNGDGLAYVPRTGNLMQKKIGEYYMDGFNFGCRLTSTKVSAQTSSDMANCPLPIGTFRIGNTSEGTTQIFDGDYESTDNRHILRKQDILSKTCSPFEFIVSLGKMLNLLFTKDPAEKRIYIWSKENFYDDKLINIVDKLDWKDYSIVPTTIEYAKYSYKLEQPETYASEIFNRKNKLKFGEHLYKPDFQLNAETKDLMEECKFQQLVPYRMHSVYFWEKENTTYAAPQKGSTFEVTLWRSDDDSFDKIEKNFKGAAGNGESFETYDTYQRLCCFDMENSPADDVTNAFVLFDGFEDTTSYHYFLTDDVQLTETLNGSNCHILASEKPVKFIKTAESERIVSRKIDFLPMFNYKSSQDQLSTSFMSEQGYTDLYTEFHQADVTQLYSKDARIVTIKYYLKENPNEALKHYYKFGNANFILNKVNDYKANKDELTKCEFIKIDDIDIYCHSNNVLPPAPPQPIDPDQPSSGDTVIYFLNGQKEFSALTSIPDGWQSGNTEIVKVSIGNDCTKIGNNAFDGCTSLTSITFNIGNTTIGDYAFANCTSLPKVTLLNTIENFGEGIFDKCTNLKQIVLPSTMVKVPDKLCSETGIVSVSLPSSVKEIGNKAFYVCPALANVDLGNVEIIGEEVFAACTALNKLVIPPSVKRIGRLALSFCNAMASCSIGENVEYIGNSAFFLDRALVSITIPKSVKEIGDAAFDFCDKIVTFNYAGTMSEWNEITLGVDWNIYCIFDKVHCSDGDITL